ncbi:MAG: hypothetical protein ACRCYY_19435 [Trueperaceae bacterium]
MANEVYVLTHDGLSQMVSSRVATRFLDKALETKGYSANSVSSEEMREILQGSILRELRQILPKDGVERSIKQITRTLRKHAETVTQSSSSTPSRITTPSVSMPPSVTPARLSDLLLPNENDKPNPEDVLDYDDAAQDLGIVNHSSPLEDRYAFNTAEVEAAIDQALQPSPQEQGNEELLDTEEQPQQHHITTGLPITTALPVQSAFMKPSRELDSETLHHMLVQFAQLDHVKVIAAVRPNGEISQSRGNGFDLDALSRLGSLGIKLLSRGRSIRSYFLSSSNYQLFLFPLGSHTLIIVGSHEINVGEVFNTLSQLTDAPLEEEV